MTIVSASSFTRGSTLVGATTNSILKQYYEPGVVDQLNSKTILRRRLKRKTVNVEGSDFHIELNTGRNHGHQYIGTGGRIPDPLQQQYRRAQYSMRFAKGRIKFDGDAASAARSDRGSFIRVMDSEIQGLSRDMLHDDNRIMFGDGSGRLAQIVSVSGNTYVLRYPGGIVSTGLGTQYLDEGMRIAVMTAANEATSGIGVATGLRLSGTVMGASINSIDHSAGSITLDTAHTGAAAGEYLYKIGNVDQVVANGALSVSRGYEPNGLAAIVDDADPVFQTGATGFWGGGIVGSTGNAGLGSIPAASVSKWRAGVISNGGIAVPFSPGMFQSAMDLADLNGDGAISAWFTTHGIRRQYLNALIAQKTFPSAMELDGGFRTLTWSDRPIFVDKDCTRGRIYGLAEESIFIAQEYDYHWMDTDGNILNRVQDYHAFEATLLGSMQLCTNARNRNVLIEDIQDV